uniref:Uncharacterized protein n=1 Tax=Amphimedon queenslandica TaxID=400682 RepID=A0A1X7TLS3_AMPQE
MINGLYVRCIICGMNVKVELLEADCHTYKKSQRGAVNLCRNCFPNHTRQSLYQQEE